MWFACRCGLGERECGEDRENGSLPLKSVPGSPLQQLPEQRNPVDSRRDPSGSPSEAMSEVWSQGVCGGEGEGAMGAGRQQVGQEAHWGMGLGMEMFLRNWKHGAKQASQRPAPDTTPAAQPSWQKLG